jgi:hypothetical protein
MTDQLDPPLRTAVGFLESHGYRYAIIGGIALAFWGVVRTTYDVDIKVLVPGLDYASIRSALRNAFPIPTRQAAPQNPLIVSVAIQDVIVDFLLALPGYEEMIIERAELGSLGNWTAWICSAEDLIIQKVVAGRSKDWPDVESLLAMRQGLLDTAYIEEWLGQFAEVLQKPELLSEFRRALSKMQRR